MKISKDLEIIAEVEFSIYNHQQNTRTHVFTRNEKLLKDKGNDAWVLDVSYRGVLDQIKTFDNAIMTRIGKNIISENEAKIWSDDNGLNNMVEKHFLKE